MAILAQKFEFGWLMVRKVYKNSCKIDKVLAARSFFENNPKSLHTYSLARKETFKSC